MPSGGLKRRVDPLTDREVDALSFHAALNEQPVLIALNDPRAFRLRQRQPIQIASNPCVTLWRYGNFAGGRACLWGDGRCGRRSGCTHSLFARAGNIIRHPIGIGIYGCGSQK